MFALEMLVTNQPQAEQVQAAFYRCLDQLADGAGGEGEAHMHTRLTADGRVITVRLWSDEALTTFRAELRL